jgi:hypothetical protein
VHLSGGVHAERARGGADDRPGRSVLGRGHPTKYALLGDIMPPSALATAVGVANGTGNLVGALAPVAIGGVIGVTGSFDAGFLVLVGAALLGGAALLPLMKNY